MKFMRNGLNKTLTMLAISMALVLPTTLVFAQSSPAPVATVAPAAPAPATATVVTPSKQVVTMPLATDPAKLQQAASLDDVKELFDSIGGVKGMGAMGIVMLVIQGLMLFFRSSLADFSGKYKLAIVYGLSLALGVISLHIAGLDWLGALLHSNTIAMAQVFGHQVYDQVLGKSAAKDAAATTAASPVTPAS